MKKLFVRNFFKNTLSNVLGGAIICIALSGCENFLNDSNLKQQLTDDIAYAKAKSISVLIQADEGTGTVVPAGNYTAKQGYPFEITFTEAAGYSFNGWKAVPADDAESLPENAVFFGDLNSIKTTVTINADISNIKIVPDCDDRISVKEKSPLLGNTVSRNSSIVVVFSKEPDEQSFIFAEDEIPAGAQVIKNDNDEIYAYVFEGETKFKNIQITINDISIAQHYLQPQVEGKTLVINANPARLIEFDQAGSSKIISVTLSDNIFDKNAVTMNKTENWKFTINEETNEKARVELTSNVEEGSVYLAGTRDYSMGQKITLSFTENADYQFLNWQYDSNIVSVDEPAGSDTFAIVKAESSATQIKAVCVPRLRVTEVSPLSTESVSKNTPIEITFNKNLPTDAEGLLQLENISITVGGAPVRTSFKTPAVSDNKITFTADMQNMLDVPSGQTKTVTVSVPADFYYLNEDEAKTKVYYGGNGKTFSYKINDTTSEKAHITFSASEGSGTITTSTASSAGYSIGQEVEISFVPSDDTWQFDGWTVDVEESKIEIKDKTAIKTVLRVYEGPLTATVKAKVSKKLSAQLSGLSLESTNPKDSDIVITFNKELASNCSSMLNQIKVTMDGNSVDSFFATRTLTGNKITLKNTRYLDVTGTRTKTVTVTVPASFYYVDESIAVTLTQGASFSYIVDSTSSKKLFVNFAMASSSGNLTPNASSQYNLGDIVDLKFNISSGYKFTGWEYYWIDEDGNHYGLVNNDEVIIDDTSAVSTKLRINQFPEDETIAGVEVYANAYLEPVIQSVKLNGKVDFFSVNSCNCDASVHISFNKEIAQSSVDFSDTGSLTLTKSGNPAVHYENYFTASWKSATELVLTPKDSVKELLPQSSDTLYLIITLNANKKNITDIDSHSLCPSDAVYNSLLLNYTIAGTTETTPPVITDIHLYSTNDTSDYYYRELSPKAFSKWTNTQSTGVEGLNYGDGIYNQNHVSSVGIEIFGYDSDSGIKEIQVTETYLRNSKNQEVVPLDVTHKYEVFPFSSTVDSAGNIIKKYSILYNFDSANTMEDGLFSIDVSLLDNAGNTSEKKTYYVIKDTTNSSNPSVKTPGDIEHLIPIYNAENNCYEMDYMFNEFKPGTDYFFEKNNENYHFVTQRYITVILKSGNIEYEIYKGDIEDTYDIADVINSAFSGRKRNVDIDEELIIKIKEESGVEGEFSIPLYKRSYIAGKASHSIYLYDQVLPTYKTDKDEVIVYFSYTPNPTKDDLTEYWYSSQEVREPEVGRISYLFCCLKTKVGNSEIYRPLYLNKPYIFYNGVDKPESDPTVRFPTITLPDTSLESGEIQYEPNTGRATFSINLNYPDDGYDYSQYTYILYIGDGTLVGYADGREEGDQCYSDTSKITTWTGRIHNVYLIAYNSDCEEVAKSEPQQLNLKVVDNHSPVMYLYGNNHQSYNSINNYHYMYSQILYATAPYDYNEKKDTAYNLTSVDCYFVPTSYGKALSKDYVTSGLFKKASLSLSENYRSDGYFSIPYDGIDFGRYYVYFYLEDNSPLHNWSITPGSYPLVYYVADYAPDFAVDTENDKINISAPTYTDKLVRTSDFPQSGASSGTYTRWNIHSNYAIIQVLEDNKWTESVACSSWEGPGEMTNNNTAYYYSYYYDDYIWVYSADCDTYSGKFVRVNVNFTSPKSQWTYQIGGNEFDIVQSQPIFVYPDYLRYKGTSDEIICNNKNWIEGANGYQIFTDNPMFVHTMYCSRNLSEVLKVEKTNPTTEQYIREWESRAQEGGMVTYNDTKLTSFTYGMDNIRDIPSGYYYTTIVHFADGTTLMSDVKQK